VSERTFHVTVQYGAGPHFFITTTRTAFDNVLKAKVHAEGEQASRMLAWKKNGGRGAKPITRVMMVLLERDSR